MKKLKDIIIHKVLPMLIVIIGILITAYPWISNYIYQDKTSSLIDNYEKITASIKKESLKATRQKIKDYNENLQKEFITLKDPFNEDAINQISNNYGKNLPFKIGDMIGYIKIPTININLPIYHGTTNTILESGVGHLDNTSIPIGGVGTHSVLTGHTGLSNKKLFTDLTELKINDLFFIHSFGETICYKISEINVVLPNDTRKLQTIDNEDLCTLVTCTPYGVNTHRLLVTGKRTEYHENMENEIKPTKYISDWRLEYITCIIIGLLIAIGIVIIIKIIKKRRKRHYEKETH